LRGNTEGGIEVQIKVGEIIKAKREEKKISLVDFAREIGISPAYLSQLENGRKENPKLEIMLSITQALDIDLEMLLGLEQELESPALRIPSLLRLVIAKDRNLRVLDDKEVQKKISSFLDRVLECKYLIEDRDLYALFLEDINIQMENTLKRYMAMEILMNNK
jgi:transcriptional regulator with XRE-family HTH domain